MKLDPLEDDERGIIVSHRLGGGVRGPDLGQAAYSASKGGIAALTMPAARELAQFGIRVLTIAPGMFLPRRMLRRPARRTSQTEPRRRRSRSQSASAKRGAVRRAGARAACANSIAQRRGDPARRRAAHGAEVRGMGMLSNTRTIRVEWGRLRPGRHRVLPALFRDVRDLHPFAVRARDRHDQVSS